MGQESFNYERAVSILGQAVSRESHTREGRDRMADFTVDCLRDELGGEVRKVVYGTGANVYAYFGHLPPDKTTQNTLITWHLDSVGPHRGFAEQGIDPYVIRHMNGRPEVLQALGIADLKYAQAVLVEEMKDWQKWLPPEYGVTALIVDEEEDQSQGMDAAGKDGLLAHITRGISKEIEVKSAIDDDPILLVGRPGRVAIEVRIEGEPSHTGGVTMKRGKTGKYAFKQFANAIDACEDVRLPEHPNDFANSLVGNVRRTVYETFQKFFPQHRRDVLMPRGVVVPTFGRLDAPGGMSIANEGWFDADILYSNPDVSPEELCAVVEGQLRAKGIRCTVNLAPGRVTPPTGPWREDFTASRFLQSAYRSAKSSMPEGDRLKVGVAQPTADEPVIRRYSDKPIVCVPPFMQGEHTVDEAIDLRRTLKNQVPFTRTLIQSPGKLRS